MLDKKLTCDTMVTERERRLIELLRETGYGQVVIYLENGQPVRIELVRKSIKL